MYSIQFNLYTEYTYTTCTKTVFTVHYLYTEYTVRPVQRLYCTLPVHRIYCTLYMYKNYTVHYLFTVYTVHYTCTKTILYTTCTQTTGSILSPASCLASMIVMQSWKSCAFKLIVKAEGLGLK